jgi:hypothetical protein
MYRFIRVLLLLTTCEALIGTEEFWRDPLLRRPAIPPQLAKLDDATLRSQGEKNWVLLRVAQLKSAQFNSHRETALLPPLDGLATSLTKLADPTVQYICERLRKWGPMCDHPTWVAPRECRLGWTLLTLALIEAADQDPRWRQLDPWLLRWACLPWRVGEPFSQKKGKKIKRRLAHITVPPVSWPLTSLSEPARAMASQRCMSIDLLTRRLLVDDATPTHLQQTAEVLQDLLALHNGRALPHPEPNFPAELRLPAAQFGWLLWPQVDYPPIHASGLGQTLTDFFDFSKKIPSITPHHYHQAVSITAAGFEMAVKARSTSLFDRWRFFSPPIHDRLIVLDGRQHSLVADALQAVDHPKQAWLEQQQPLLFWLLNHQHLRAGLSELFQQTQRHWETPFLRVMRLP